MSQRKCQNVAYVQLFISFLLLFFLYPQMFWCHSLTSVPLFIVSPDVGFKVGRNSGMSYFVLQIHYGDVNAFKGESLL